METPKMQEEGVQPERKQRIFGVMEILYILIGVGIIKIYTLVNSIQIIHLIFTYFLVKTISELKYVQNNH